MGTKKTTDAQSMSRAKLACAMPCKKEEEQNSTPVTETIKKVYNLIIVDESGSMSIIHSEALAGLNETIITCQQMQKVHPEMEQCLTLISFDSEHFKFHYDNVNANEARHLTMRDYQPSGATPLYDAIGKGLAVFRPWRKTLSVSRVVIMPII